MEKIAFGVEKGSRTKSYGQIELTMLVRTGKDELVYIQSSNQPTVGWNIRCNPV